MNTKTETRRELCEKRSVRAAFTVVELIIVIVIIGILAAVIIPTVTASIDKAKAASDDARISTLNQALALSFDMPPPKTAYDVRRILQHYGYSGTDLNCESKDTYCFYNRESGKIERLTITESSIPQAQAAEGLLHTLNEPEELFRGYVLIENAGSPLAEAVHSIRNGMDGEIATGYSSIDAKLSDLKSKAVVVTGSQAVVSGNNGSVAVILLADGIESISETSLKVAVESKREIVFTPVHSNLSLAKEDIDEIVPDELESVVCYDDGVLECIKEIKPPVSVFDRETQLGYEVSLKSNLQGAGELFGAGKYLEGTVISLTAQPQPQYSFAYWSKEGERIDSMSYTVPDTDTELTGNFEVKKIEVSYGCEPLSSSDTVKEGNIYGEIHCDKTGEFPCTESAILTVTAAEGYQFVGWYINDELKGTDSEYTVNSVEDVTVIARFSSYVWGFFANGVCIETYENIEDEVTVESGNIPINSEIYVGKYDHGVCVKRYGNAYTNQTAVLFNCADSITFYREPSSSRVFGYFDVNGNLSNDDDATINADYSYFHSANASKVKISSDGSNFTDMSRIGDSGVFYISKGNFSFTEGNVYYRIDDSDTPPASATNAIWGHCYKPGVNHRSTMNGFFSGEFTSLSKYTLELRCNVDAHDGTAKGEGKLEYYDMVTVEAIESGCGVFEGWYEGETLISSEKAYTFYMPQEALTLEARFTEEAGYSVNVTCDTGVIVKGNGNYLVGRQVTLEAEIGATKEFDGWYKGDTCVSTLLTYTFDMPDKNIELAAKIKQLMYELYINGVLSDDKPIEGDTCEFSGITLSLHDTIYIKKGDEIYGNRSVKKADGSVDESIPIFIGGTYVIKFSTTENEAYYYKNIGIFGSENQCDTFADGYSYLYHKCDSVKLNDSVMTRIEGTNFWYKQFKVDGVGDILSSLKYNVVKGETSYQKKSSTYERTAFCAILSSDCTSIHIYTNAYTMISNLPK